MSGLVTLRETRESDWPILFEHQRDPASAAMAAVPARDWETYVAHQRTISADENNVTQTILLDDEVVGSVMSFPHEGQREVGYRIDRAYWGRGIATAALAQFLRQVEQRRPLSAWVAAHNPGSRRVLEKCGFTVVGADRGDDGVQGVILTLAGSDVEAS